MQANFVSHLKDVVEAHPEKTAFIFLADGQIESERLTYAELDLRARLIAAHLQSQCQPGDRILLCYPHGLEFICAFLGCLYAGMIAVPAFPLRNNRHAERLLTMVDDCNVSLILGTDSVINFMRGYEDFRERKYLATDTLDTKTVNPYIPVDISSDDIAFLQYTSGSTGHPKGVMVSHANILHNAQGLEVAFGFDKTENKVSAFWIPVQHDMSLVGEILVMLYVGGTGIMMAPTSFISSPLNWLKAISHYHAHYAAAPNFAYDLCVEKIREEDKQELDLRSWQVAMNASEPVRWSTLNRFAEAFTSCGFSLNQFMPAYGLAEVTLLVTGSPPGALPVNCVVNKTAYEQRKFLLTPADANDAIVLASSGPALWADPPHELLIVDPEEHTVCTDENMGEVWIKSQSVAHGYWQKPELTKTTFQAYLSDGRGPYLRTGDLGVLYKNELYITGRIKDIIIIQGRNLYPQDIEAAVEESHKALRLDCTAAFSIEREGEEQVVVVAEIERTARKVDTQRIFAAMHTAIIESAEVVPYSLVLLQPAQALKTTSGKIQRQATKRAYLDHTLNILAEETSGVIRNESIKQDYSTLAQDLKIIYQKILAIDNVKETDKFSLLGGDSFKALELYDALQTYLGNTLSLSTSVAFDYPSLAELFPYIEGLVKGTSPKTARATFAEATPNEPIAIIGMSCRFPGSENTEAFWELLQMGKTAVGPIPQSRAWLNTYLTAPGYGGFIENIEYFDASLFSITPREAERMDPQQRIVLEVTWEALEAASIHPLSLSGSATGVFFGAMGSEYKELLLRSGEYVADAYFATGNDISVIAGRAAYTFGLQGPTVTIDTACSSSLVAINEACMNLREGKCSLAIAGGVNALLSADEYEALTQAQMLAPDGSCKTFDKDANGYVRGEGCGIIILKRLSDALRDNDNILAVIKGSAVNQDGASSGLTVPNGLAQEQLLQQALADARLTPHDIDYIETHGTGTRLGDPMEVNAINRVFAGSRSENQYLYLGAVKTNIGHLEAAAGIASVIKAILALQHETIPANLHFTELNPQIDLEVIPAQLPLQLIEWKKTAGKPRHVGVSSFGFSGTNAHVILEEAPEQNANKVKQALPKTIFNRQRYWSKVLDEKQRKPYEWKKTLPLVAERDISTSNLTWVIIGDEKGVSESLNALLQKHGAKTKVYPHTVSWEDIKTEIMQESRAGVIYFSQGAPDIDYESLLEVDAPLWIIFPQIFSVEEGGVDVDSLPLESLAQAAFFKENAHTYLIGVPQEFSAMQQIAKAIYAELCQKQPTRYAVIGKTRFMLVENIVAPPKTVTEKNEIIEALPTSPAALHNFILEHVREKALNVLGMDFTTSLDEKGFFDLGMDSLMAVELNKELIKIFPTVTLSSTATFDNPSILKLTALIEGETTGVKPQILTSLFVPNEPIAIIGMSCRFPAGANSPEILWQLLEQGFEGGMNIPKNRWDVEDYPDIYVHRAGLLTIPVDEFAAEFFNISPREAEYMDPQQRILLEETWLAVEDARIAPSTLKESNTGVFVGICSHDYYDLLSNTSNNASESGYATTGNTASIAAGRIAYSFGFKGPCVAVDTACSSSLVSVHLACQSLRVGESDMAVAGGVNVILSPLFMESLCELHMLSPEGYCKTFDKNADGYMRGEGCGMIVLKRLSDATRDNDRILAIIKGSAMNQDGASSGLMVPNGTAQEAVIRKALQQAQLTPADIDYVEVHGTATSLGDPIEVNALVQVFNGHQRPLTLGTIKTNVGHLEGAAGIAGIIKTILALQHEKIPRHLHFHELNPAISFEAIPAQIPLEPIEWKKEMGRTRYAGISSFGFSGTNAHVILEEAPLQDVAELRQPLPKTIFKRQRYWSKELNQIHKESLLGEEIHPLLGYRLPEGANQTAIIYEQKFQLNHDDFHYLEDHQVCTHVIFPASGYIELFLTAVHNEKTIDINLTDLHIERPLQINDYRTVVQVIVVHSKLSTYTKTSAGWLLHSECDFLESTTAYETLEPLSVLEHRINNVLEISDFYNRLKKVGFTYGPNFKLIQQVKMTEQEALIYLETSTFDSRYLAYPALVDGGLQGLNLFGEEGLYLPVSCKQIYWQQALPSTIVAHVRLREKTQENILADIHFYVGESCVLQLNGFHARRVSKNALLKMLSGKEEKYYYEPVWEVYAPVLGEKAKDIVVYDARTPQQEISIIPALSLLSYLKKHLNERTIYSNLFIITENAYGNKIDLGQSALNGFIKTAILEHPELHIHQLDVPENMDLTPLLEIAAKDTEQGQILQYRDNQWLREHIEVQRGLILPDDNYRLVKSEAGILEQLTLIDEDLLSIGDNEILIAPQAAGLNFRDVLNAMNLYPGDPGPLGGDVAGIVAAVGKNVKNFHVGDEVLGLGRGTLSSQTITHEALITLKPPTIDFTEAAAIPTIFMTAYLALVKLADLKTNETILIHAGTGGVGLAAIQIAQHLKANIIATTSSEHKRTYLQSLGIEHVFDSRSLSFKEDILRVTDNRGVDVILNSLSGKGFIDASLESAAPQARFVEIGKRDIWSEEAIHAKRSDIIYYILALDQLSMEHPEQVRELLHEVMQWFSAQILNPVPQTVFTLTEAVAAFKYLQQAKQIGKVVITLPPAKIEFNNKASYLITGGLGGVGLEIAHYLIEHGAKRIILTGRHEPKTVTLTKIEEMRSQGIDIITALCDVSVADEINKLIKTISTEDYPLKGIFHLAGILKDAPLDKQTEVSFTDVFAPKAHGAWNLHEATKDLHLDYFVLFSSMASLNGSQGQSNYATANSVLDALATYRQQQGLPAISINWGPWRDVGMAKDLIASHERQGLKPLNTKTALTALTYALKQPIAQLGIMQVDWKRMSDVIGVPSWLENIIGHKQDSDFIQRLEATPLSQRDALLKQAVMGEVKKVLGQTQTPDESKGFFDMGMDSLMALELKNRLQGFLGVSLSNTLAFDYPNLNSLLTYLSSLLKITALPVFKPQIQYLNQSDPIAIIGMNCRFPGGAESSAQFWTLLEAGFDSSIDVPKDRWDIDAYYDPNPNTRGKIISRKSSFITSPIANFDANFFGITPREAELMDPQQRLLLEVTWEALEDAGIGPKTLNQTLTGVFIGLSSHDYEDLLTQSLSTESIDAYLETGNTASVATGRISYTLGLQGPSMTIDTACSSSLVALHQACQSLRLGECDMAISGGVNVILSPAVSIDFSQAHMLAADGHCKTFDQAADGYVRGEGCGIVVLKRLSDAKRDNDRILAVIKGSAVNQDGATSGLTVPNGPAQEAVIKRALMQAQVEPSDIDYIEAHGTGTALGDPIEFNALAQIFKGRANPLTIGTVKTNIGHLEAAAGIAGVIKTILALQHEKIPRHLHFKEINSSIDLNVIPAQIPLQSIEWKKETGKIRRAGISSFGFSGTNAHIILEEAPAQDASQVRESLPKTIFNRQRYWVAALENPHKENILGTEIHPLLGYRLAETAKQTSIIYEQKIELAKEGFKYLADHHIYDHVLYPATGYIELLLRATKIEDSYDIALSMLNIEKPLELSAPITVIEVIVENDTAAIYSHAATDWVLHSTGKIERHPVSATTETLEQLEARINTKVNIEDFYNRVKAAGITYGPSFQVLKKALIAENEALIYLESCLFDSRYLAYPALVDGGLQALALFEESGLFLPVSCEQIYWQQSLPSKVIAHVRQVEKTQDSIHADIHFYSGDSCALQLNGLRALRVSKNTILKMLTIKEEKLFYEPVWEVYTPVLNENAKEVLVYDARTNQQAISIDPAIALLSYLQKLLKEKAAISGLYIITENAYGDKINLSQSALNGLIKTAILEHPELQIRQLDVAEDVDTQPLITLLAKDKGAAQILQYRDQQWFSEYIVSQRGLILPSDNYRLVKSENGILEQLTLIEEETISIGKNDILIVPHAVGLNFRDVLNAMNLYPGDPGPLGGDVAGIVKAVGNHVNKFHVGDEVLGLALGSLSSQTLTQENLIALKPKTLSFTEAAAIPTVFMTAYQALLKLADLQADETVLIHAGTGGVGLAAIQIAHHLKAKIIATAGSEKKRDYLRSLGVEHVFDSRSLSFKDDILRVTNNRGVDVILNSLSGKGFIAASLDSAAPNARFVEIGKRDIWSEEDIHAKRRDIIYHVLALDQLFKENPESIQVLLQEVIHLFELQQLKPIPQTIFPLSQAVAAFKYLQQAKQIGKVVITLPPAEIKFKGNASYLITGGLGAVGLEVARYLSEQGAKHIILTGRHDPSALSTSHIQEIRAQGIEIITTVCDVNVSVEINKLIKTISTDYPLKGIFHLAGIIDDAPLDKQTDILFNDVFAPKALGAWNLHEATKDLNLDCFVLFSSLASLNGSAGQSNYATANSVLDALALYRQQQGLHAISINWGPWREVGMAKDLVASHERQGINPLKTKTALSALTHALKQPVAQLGIMQVDWQKISSVSGVPSWLENLVGPKPESNFINRLQATPIEQREALLKQAILSEVKKVLGQTQILDEREGFFDMGMDSLMALELKNRLQLLINHPLSNSLIFDYPNVKKLHEYLVYIVLDINHQEINEKSKEEKNLNKYLSLSDEEVNKMLDEDLDND